MEDKKITLNDILPKDVKLDEILEFISQWSKINNVCFFGNFISFDDKKLENKEDDVIKEDRMLCFGDRETLAIMLGSFIEEFSRNTDEFIDW